MQRFYQAVELDEAEMARKRSASVEPNTKKKMKTMDGPTSTDKNESVSVSAATNQLVNKLPINMKFDFLIIKIVFFFNILSERKENNINKNRFHNFVNLFRSNKIKLITKSNRILNRINRMIGNMMMKTVIYEKRLWNRNVNQAIRHMKQLWMMSFMVKTIPIRRHRLDRCQ